MTRNERLVWKDSTSYQRDAPHVPHWWTVEITGTRISVGDSHIYYKDNKTWLLQCAPWFNTHVLKAQTEKDAKKEAVELVLSVLEAAAADLRVMKGQEA